MVSLCGRSIALCIAVALLATSVSYGQEESEELIVPDRALQLKLQTLQDRLDALETERAQREEYEALPLIEPSWRYMAPLQSNSRTLGAPFFAGPSAYSPMESSMLDEVRRPPGFPIRVNDVSVAARGAVVFDSTRLDPLSKGLFLPSAIPVFGEPFHGLGHRASVQGQGSSVGLSWLADLGAPAAVSGGVRVEVFNAADGDLTVITPQAWVRWNRVLLP